LRIAVAVGAALVLGLLAIVLLQSQPRLSGSNAKVRTSGVALVIEPGGRRCHRQDVPADTRAVRLFASPVWVGAGPLTVAISDRGRRLAQGRAASILEESVLRLPLDRALERDLWPARVCISNDGATPAAFAGDRTPVFESPTNPGSELLDDDVRVDLLRPGRESWVDLASSIDNRFALGKASFFGPWTIWAVLVLVVLTWIAALRFLWRQAGSE